jgi:hypothetical protein
MIIGITGKKRHGKDTVAKALVNDKSVKAPCIRIAFADALKEEVATMIVDISNPGWRKESKEFGLKTIDSIVSEMNSDEIDPLTGKAKKEEYRLVLQWWGTEFRRKRFGNDYWVTRMAGKIAAYETKYQASAFGSDFHIVIPDVRFLDEAEYIRKVGGQIWKVERSSIQSNDQHQSEAEIDLIEPDWTILNGSSLEFCKLVTLNLYHKVINHGQS